MKMDSFSCHTEKLLANFPPSLRENFRELFCRGRVALSALTLNDITPTKHYSENNSSYSYYYTVKIPYAGKRLSWELIFDPQDISFAPDFNFNDDTFHLITELDVVAEHLPGLTNWNVNDPKALTAVLQEVINLFKKQQLKKLQNENVYSQLNSEYQILIEETHPNDVEVFLDSTSAHFLINIKVDVTSLPEYLQPLKDKPNDNLLSPGEDACFVKISYNKLDGSDVKTSLQLSPRLEQVLGNSRSLHVPSFAHSSLADYINLITKLTQNHITTVEQHHKLKKEFVTSLAVMYNKNMVEFDSRTFSNAQFLCEVDGYYCHVCVEIGDRFPDEKPIVTLQSLYCPMPKKICTENFTDFSYSPQWSVEMMLQILRKSLSAAITHFKNHKH